MTVGYKVVETSNVTDEELEKILNEWTRQGWSFDTIHFAMREASKRPSMAFVTFTRELEPEETSGGGSTPQVSPTRLEPR